MPDLEMLPCPFCGEEARHNVRQDESIWSHNIVDWHSIGCPHCEISMEQCEGFDEVLESWNSRTKPSEDGTPDPGIQSDWERAHALLDAHGVLTTPPHAIGEHLIDRLEAVLKVWDAIGEHSAQCCHDLRFLCNSTPEVNRAIDAHRAAYRG